MASIQSFFFFKHKKNTNPSLYSCCKNETCSLSTMAPISSLFFQIPIFQFVQCSLIYQHTICRPTIITCFTPAASSLPAFFFFRLLGCMCVNQCPRVVSYESVELLLVQNWKKNQWKEKNTELTSVPTSHNDSSEQPAWWCGRSWMNYIAPVRTYFLKKEKQV